MKTNRILLSVLCLIFLSSLSFGQSQVGKIVGTVTDTDGNALPGVLVKATSPKLVGEATSVTDENGVYRLLNLVPGTYTISFSMEGFDSVEQQGAELSMEQTLQMNQKLTLGKIENIVKVIGEAPLIDVKSQSKGVTLKKEVFQSLPKGRNFDALATTVPGVNDEPLLSGTSVDGASGAENMFYVDGVNTNDLANGESGQDVSFDFVEEVQFKSSGYNAEFGGSVGGVINVVTRSGGNEFHGEFIGYYRSDWLTTGPNEYWNGFGRNGRDLLALDVNDDSRATYYTAEEATGILEYNRFELGLNLGGYIIKDKVWFFASLMPNLYNRTGTYDFALQGYDGPAQEHTRKTTTMNYLVKLTAQPFKNVRIGASYVNNTFSYEGNRNVFNNASSTTLDHSSFGFTFPNFTISGYADITLGNNLMLSVRGGWFYTDQKDQLVTVTEPRYSFFAEQPYGYANTTNERWASQLPAEYVKPASGWTNFGYGDGYETKKSIRDRYNVNGDLTYFLNAGGEHSIKAGVQFINQGENVDSSPSFPYIYFGWDMDFEAYGVSYGRGTYGWAGVRGNSMAPFGNLYNARANRWAMYIQDSWTIGNKLTLNFGVRTESEYIPNYTDNPDFMHITKPLEFTFADKLSPRFGFVYDVFGDSSLKVFGSFGIFQDVMKLNLAAGAFGGFKWKSAYYPLESLEWWTMDGEFGGMEPYVVLDHRTPSYESTDPDMKPFTQREIAFGFEKKLMENLSLSTRFVWKSVLYAIEDLGVLVPGEGEHYYYTNPGSDFINDKYQTAREAGLMEPDTPDMPDAKREYYAANISIDKRFSNNWQGGISATISSLKGNYAGLASSDENGRNSPNTERSFDLWHLSYTKDMTEIDGPLPTDRAVVLKAYGSYVFPFGVTVGLVVNALSGTPVTEEWNVDAPSFYPYGRGNLGRTPFLMFANALVEYNVKLGGVTLNLNANVENLLDAKTATAIYNLKTRFGISPTDRQKLDNSWTFESMGGEVDPRYEMDRWFLDPLEVRLGVKIMF